MARINDTSGKTFIGTSSTDRLIGSIGDDTFIYTLNTTNPTQDIYNGKGGVDTLELRLSYQQWIDSNIQTQFMRYLAWSSKMTNNAKGEFSSGSDFIFDFGQSTTLKIQMIENLVVKLYDKDLGLIDQDLIDQTVVANDDSVTLASAWIDIQVLENDIVPDRAKTLTYANLSPTETHKSLIYGTVVLQSSADDISSPWYFKYNLDATDPDYKALGGNVTLADSFSYTVTDVDGDSATAIATIMVTGINDTAIITGQLSGLVVEAGLGNNGGTPIARGQLTVTDPDTGENSFRAAGGSSGYGFYNIDASGQWSYTLNNQLDVVDALRGPNGSVGADTMFDAFTVQSLDGTSQLVTIVISGAKDAAIISGVTSGEVIEAGLSNNGGRPIASGQLSVADPDTGENGFRAAAGSSNFGFYDIDISGNWKYTLNNDLPVVDTLRGPNGSLAAETLADTFAVQSFDGTIQTVTITITGADDIVPTVANPDVLWVTSGTNVNLPTAILMNNDTSGDKTALSVIGMTVKSGGNVLSNLALHTEGSSAFFSFDSGTSTSTVLSPTVYEFTYTIRDGSTHLDATTTVTVNVVGLSASASNVDLRSKTYTGAYLMGGAGDDTFYGGNGINYLYGGDGKDALFGEEGDDYLYGENGDDDLYGKGGNDRLFGGADSDKLYGGGGNDTLLGGDGVDYFAPNFEQGYVGSFDTVMDFNSDKIELPGLFFGSLDAEDPTYSRTFPDSTKNDGSIYYDVTSGELFYGFDQIALIGTSDPHPTLSNDNFYVTPATL